MKILILGGSRFIGKAIADQAAAAGHEVHLFNRGKSAETSAYPLIQGDLADLPDYRPQFEQLAPDVVVHCMALSEADARRTAEAFAGINCQLMVLGSCDCYAAFQRLNRGQDPGEMPLHENSPLSPIRHYYADISPARAMAEYDKNLMTDALMQAGEQGLIRPTVFRLPMVYGPEDYQYPHRHGSIVHRIRDKHKQYVIGSARQQVIWPFAYIENIAAAIVHGFGLSLDQGIYNLGEPTTRSWRRWVTLFGEAANFAFELEVLPDEWLSAESERNAPPQHILLDTSAYRQLTGFSEPVDLETGIERTLNWGLAHPESLGPVPDYAGEAAALGAYLDALKRHRPD